MPCYIKCPTCNTSLSDVVEYYKLVIEEIREKSKNLNVSTVDLTPDSLEPIGDILDALGIRNECCRIRMTGLTQFEKLYH